MSFLRNCLVIASDGESDLFEANEDGQGRTVYIARLDGYAIIPMKVYLGLTPKSGPIEPPTLPSRM
jgi:hypothetical protein